MMVIVPTCGTSVDALKSVDLGEVSTIIVLSGRRCRDDSVLNELVALAKEKRIHVIEAQIDEDRMEDAVLKLATGIKRVWRGGRILMLLSLSWVGCLAPILAISVLPPSMKELCTVVIDGIIVEMSKLSVRERPRLRLVEKKIVELLEIMGGCSRAKDIANSLGVSRATLYRSLNRLIEQGLVRRASRGVYCVERESR